MNTPIKFELAKLLKEKGFDEPCTTVVTKENTHHLVSGVEHTIINGMTYIATTNSRLPDTIYSAPTIAEVVMWLYEERGIWISVYRVDDSTIFRHTFSNIDFNSPTEAYEAAIEYTLKNLIQ